MVDRSYLENLCDIIDSITYDTLPSSVIEKSKLSLADYLGVLCAGSGRTEARSLYRSLGGSSIANNREALAFWMGSASRLLDMDDGHRHAMGHPGVVIGSAAMACVFTMRSISPQALLTAVVRGYEVYCYQGRIINPSAYLDRGFDATCVCGAAGAATVVATLLELTREQLQHAISIAMSLCGGLNQYAVDGGSPKYLCAGWAAKLGVNAAELAKNGLTGPTNIFEGRLGYIHGFSQSPNLENVTLTAPRWEILNTYLKRYACVRRIHTTLDILEELCAEHSLTADRIKEVRVYGAKFICDAAIYAPWDIVKAQTSIPYAASVLLNRGEVSSAQMEACLTDETITSFSKRVKVIYDQEMVDLLKVEPSLYGAARIDLELTDNRVFSKRSDVAIGDPEHPFSKDVLYQKFTRMMRESGNRALHAASIWECIDMCEAHRDVEPIFSALQPLIVGPDGFEMEPLKNPVVDLKLH